MDNDREPIYKWLSAVNYPDQSRHQNAAEKKQQRPSGAELTGISLAQLESPECLCEIHRSARKRRSIGNLDQSRKIPHLQSPTRDEGRSKKARHSYERRPRHKTHDSHYEYKAPSAAGYRPQARKRQSKSGRGRKYTLNDDFQAVNVTGNRLTIQSQATLGIFNKGKTSSAAGHLTKRTSNDPLVKFPSKTCKRNVTESDLTFSEMKFLSRRKNISPGRMSSVPEDTPCVQHEKRNQRNTSVYSHSKNVLYDALAQAKKSVIGLGQQVDISPSPLPSLIVAPKNDISLGLKHSLCASQSKQIQENEPSEKLSSSGDTWPESEVHDTPEDHALPQYLLEIMRTGLKFETDSGISFDNLSNLRYWSLSELWGLLEQRKVSWSADSVKNQQAPPAPKMRDWGSTTEAIHLLPESIEPPPLELEYADANERIALSPNLRDASGPSGEVHSDLLGKEIQRDQHQKHERNSSDALSQAIEYSRISGALAQDHQSKPSAHALTNVEHFAGLSHQELLTSAPDLGLEQLNSVADDDLFYETLDAAYDAIIHTAAGGQEFALDAFEMPILLMSSKLNEANDFFATPNMVRPTSNVTPVQVVKTAQLRKPSPIATKAERERMGPELLGVDNCDGLPREFSEDKSCDQHKSLPWLIGYNNPQMSITTSRTLDQKQDPNLPDFWRQNKLY